MAIKLKKDENSEPEVLGTESFGIPKDCTKKQKFNKLKLVFYIVAVAAICVTGYKYYNEAVDFLLPEITFDKTKQPVIYSKPSQIVIRMQKGKSKVLSVADINDESQKVIKTADRGKTVFFMDKADASLSGCEFYVYSVENDKVKKIAEDVADYKINADGKFAVYREGNALYFTDFENSRKISDDVSEYFLSKNNQVITFLSSDGKTLYTCGTGENEKAAVVDRNVQKIVTPKDEHVKIYYIKDSTLYLKEYDTGRKRIAKDVIDAIMVGDTVYYTTSEAYNRPIEDFLFDEMADADRDFEKPDGAKYIKEVDGVSIFKGEDYAKDKEEYNKKLIRDEIRSYFKENKIITKGYSLYAHINDERKIVDTNLSTPYLSYNSCKNIIAYKKNDISSVVSKDLKELAGIEEIEAVISQVLNTTPDIDMYLVKDGKKPIFALEYSPSMQVEISLDGKYLYCIESKEDATAGVLAKYKITPSELDDRTEIENGVTDFALDGSDSSAVMVFKGDELSLYYNDELIRLSDKSCREFFFVDRTLYFYDDYDYDTKSGTLCSVKNKKISEIDKNVHCFDVRKHDTVSYIKDYNPDLKTGMLYVKDNGKTVYRDAHVKTIIN